jgi:ATP/maltotriose-dependent transcriptional regulator MalT
MAEPMMALYDGDADRALRHFELGMTASDTWMRAMARVYRASYLGSLGRMDGVEADCRAALEEFRALGDKWGMALSLAQLAEFSELRGDHAASLVILEESGEVGRDLNTWGDLPYIQGRRATVLARAGDLPGAWSAWQQAERAQAGLGGYTDSGRYLNVMRAEIAWRAGDLAEVTRCCAEVLGALRAARAAWWESLRALVKVALAMVALREGDPPRARDLLTQALASATGWVERPPLAAVIDAAAAFTLAAGPGGDGDPEAAATLLGAAHAVRGAFDESSIVAPGTRATARERLGDAAFAAAYAAGRDLGPDGALALVQRAMSE